MKYDVESQRVQSATPPSEALTLDVQSLRSDTLGCTDLVYLNNAGAGLMPTPVLAAVRAHLDRESRTGAYAVAAEAEKHLQDGYQAAAKLLHCGVDEIAFTQSNTHSWHAAVGAIRFKPGDRVLTGRSEWGGNYASLLHLSKLYGLSLEVVPNDESGAISIEALRRMIDGRVSLIALTWLPAGGGLINPAEQVGQVARTAGVPFVLDAAQAVGQVPVDVRAIGCDVLTAPGRKWLRGPRGSGLLYMRRAFLEAHEPGLLDHFSAPLTADGYELRNDARRFETAEASVAVRLGLCAALHYALALGVDRIHARVSSLAERVRDQLGRVRGITLRDTGCNKSALVAFTLAGHRAMDVRDKLAKQRIDVVANGVAFTPLDFRARGLQDVVRISAHVYNTETEIDRVVEAVDQIAAGP